MFSIRVCRRAMVLIFYMYIFIFLGKKGKMLRYGIMAIKYIKNLFILMLNKHNI